MNYPRNPKDILALGPNPTREDLERVYRRAARRYHPDKCHGAPDANTLFARVNVLYQQLARILPSMGRQVRKRPTEPVPGLWPQVQEAPIAVDLPASVDATVKIPNRRALAGTTRKVRLRQRRVFGMRRTLVVHVPPGTTDGTVLRLLRAGFPPAPGVPPSDVYVAVHVRGRKRPALNVLARGLETIKLLLGNAPPGP